MIRAAAERRGVAMTGYRVPFMDAESEFVEKRSRFISQIWRVETEAEARAHLEAVRKKYYDARHHCWCYLLKEGAVRYSDDGEPQGTAGQPMLNVFQRQEAPRICPGSQRRLGRVGYMPGESVDAVGDSVPLFAAGAD